MPGARSRVRPAPASELSASDEASQLELQLQRQLEEDVARIFDESIYSDLEVVCGKLKILTHSCILKARTNNFYHKLETILHVNIGRNTFDEIYSFISDAYTECNINHQEREIISYLNDNLKAAKSLPNNTLNTKKEDTEEIDVFLTPKSVSPYFEKGFQKTISASPSTELTKEYYALVPIDGNLLEKELNEQDVLSNAFQSIIKCQTDVLNKLKVSQRNKPTSLSLTSSHIISKPVKHSNSCDILNNHLKDTVCIKNSKSNDKIINICTSHSVANTEKNYLNEENVTESGKNSLETTIDKVVDSNFSPDSLITDDPSSSSDYLSAAYTCSPGVSYTGGHPQLNVGESIANMDNIITSSDSGLETTGMLESLNSHKDVTLTDVSLTESTLHDLTIDDPNNSVSSSFANKNLLQRFKPGPQSTTSGTSAEKEFNGLTNQSPKVRDACKSSKEEKQRQNEEIVILESSSLSSETGSWESMFPPKLPVKEICQKFICSERQCSTEGHVKHAEGNTDNYTENFGPSLVQKSPFKSTSCFIDASSLADEDDETIKVQTEINEISVARPGILPEPSQPVPCSSAKSDISPHDWSESNENEDSLEQADKKDPDSIQKDLSPTIFEMTPITEDSLCGNTFENAPRVCENDTKDVEAEHPTSLQSFSSNVTVCTSSTPHNSIMSLRASSLKQYDTEESESDTTVMGYENQANVKKCLMKYNESSPIVSGGASIEDHLPQIASHSGSPLTRRKMENMPIVSGAYVPHVEENTHRKVPKPSCAPAWVVDMSSSSKSAEDRSSPGVTHMDVKKPRDRTCDILRNGSKSSLDSFYNQDTGNKSRSSVDSDSSEKSSHKFYIDLSSLPDPTPKKSNESENATEKKNIFSMYIDLGDKPTLKEMPARLSSSLNSRKSTPETKLSKSCKTTKVHASECAPAAFSGITSICAFEKYESLCNDTELDIAEIINILDKDKPSKIQTDPSKSDIEIAKDVKHIVSVEAEKCSQRYATTAIQEEPAEPPAELFVKLSDLDKPVLKMDTMATVKEERVLDVRMTRSIPENNWGDGGAPGASRSIEVISSFHSENALSLNRLFPHLKNEFSRSMPGSLSGRTRSPLRLAPLSSPGDLDEQPSDMSEMSSVQSSMCRSVVENSTTEETSQTSSLIGNCQSRLGQDLLRMFLEEIAPDVIVEVSGRRIRAHKCILSSRCQYFAGILSGGWVESAGNVIILPPFSFNVVHFALCHIYSGVSTIPDSISIVELATIADMLGLEGLKEAIMFTLKAKYCHHFHKPCQVCTAGVLECFPLSSVYGLDDLYRKCLRWITKYFSKVWPTKAFATLPKELLDKCYQQHIVNLTTDTLVDTVYGCGITVSSLGNSRWAESVARMCRRLVNAAAQYAAPRLCSVLRACEPQPADAPPPARQALDDCLAAAIEWAPPDEACRAYAFLSAIHKQIRNQYSKPDLITTQTKTYHTLLYTHAGSWRLQCEGALVRAAPRVVATKAFKDLPVDLRKRLRELGCIMYGAQAMPITTSLVQERKTRSPHQQKFPQNSSSSRSLDIDQVRQSFVPYAPKPAAVIGAVDIKSSSDLIDRKLKGNPPKIRTTKAQEERAKFNLTKNSQTHERSGNKKVTTRVSYENAKPRYLEPKLKDEKKPGAKKLVPKMVSSSESSRNSSPIQARNLRASRTKSRAAGAPQTMSQDSLATCSRPRTAEPSTDSLSESRASNNKYATYTKTKHTTKGSIESVNSSKNANTTQTSTNNKVRTKIPVFHSKTNNLDKQEPQKSLVQTEKVAANGSTTAARYRARAGERKVPGSLMMATKSSSAKVVPKIVKDSTPKSASKGSKRDSNHRHVDPPKTPEIPVMERSGTFLKDEPTFGDKTTNIDIDQ